MKYQIRYLPIAQSDLSEIEEYLLTYSIDTVKRFMSGLYAKLELLRENPKMYEKYNKRKPYRKMSISKDYILIYLINEDEQIIDVYRILSASRDIFHMMKSQNDINESNYVHEIPAKYD